MVLDLNRRGTSEINSLNPYFVCNLDYTCRIFLMCCYRERTDSQRIPQPWKFTDLRNLMTLGYVFDKLVTKPGLCSC